MPLHGGKLAARALKQAGVECIFTLSGGHIMPLYDGCHRRGHPHHRRAPRAGRRACGRRVGALQPGQDRRRRDHRRPRRHRRRHRRRERVARELADPRVRRSGPVREPAPRLAPGDGPHRRDAADHQVRRRRSIRRTASPSTSSSPSATRCRASRARPTSRSRWTCSWARSEESKVSIPRIRTEAPRLSPDRDEVRARDRAARSARKRPMLMAGTSVKWSRASAGDEPLHRRRRTCPTYTNGMGRGTIPPDSPEFLNRSRREALKKIDCVRARRHAARLPHGASARRSPPTRRSSSSTWTRR